MEHRVSEMKSAEAYNPIPLPGKHYILRLKKY
jgi:hypothetical protein